MEGVTILDTIKDLPGWASAVIIIGIMMFMLCGMAGFSAKDKIRYAFFAFSVLGVVAIIIAIITFSPEISYRVIVDDNVNMNEFFQKYELIRREGLIYIVKLIGV